MPLKSTDFWFWCFFLIRKFLKKYLPLAFFPKFKELRKLERPLLALQHKASEPIFWKINRFLISKSFLHQNIFLKTFRPCIFSKILETKKVRAPFGLCFSLGGGGWGLNNSKKYFYFQVQHARLLTQPLHPLCPHKHTQYPAISRKRDFGHGGGGDCLPGLFIFGIKPFRVFSFSLTATTPAPAALL